MFCVFRQLRNTISCWSQAGAGVGGVKLKQTLSMESQNGRAQVVTHLQWTQSAPPPVIASGRLNDLVGTGVGTGIGIGI